MFSVLMIALALPAAGETRLEVVSQRKIWDRAPHSAFGDLIRFRNEWFAVFREGTGHVANAKAPTDDGTLRVIRSTDGENWKEAALLTEDGVDLRDPHLSITGDGRLMITAGGSIYRNAVFGGRRPRVAFSKDGVTWTKPRRVLSEGHWLWRVTWHKGEAWGVSKVGDGSANSARHTYLVRSRDGVEWETVTELAAPGSDETTVRFLPDGRMAALIRCVWNKENLATIGISKPPFKEWSFAQADTFVGGPNFIVLPDGRMIAGGRYFRGGYGKDPVTAIGELTPSAYQRLIELPSGGDNSYPGFVWHDGLLWTLYYSSHEGKTSIYLARIRVRS